MKKYNILGFIAYMLLPLTLLAQGENWVFRYNDPYNGGDWGYAIVYGTDGNIYAAGSSEGDNYSIDFFIVSLSGAGDTNWTYRYNGPGNYYSFANAITYGDDGNIYTAGISYDTDTSYDIIVISLTTTGDTNWTYRYNGPGNGDDEAWSIIYGLDNNIYIGGTSPDIGANHDFIVISLTTAGNTNWIYRYNGPGNSFDYAQSLAYGTDGNIYATGASIGLGTNWDFIIISLATSGDTNWVYRYNGPMNNADYGYSLVYGINGKIYAGGSSSGGGAGLDAIAICLYTTGDTNWTYRYNGLANGDDEIRSITYGADGNIYATGYSNGGVTDGDAIVISLSAAGDENWIHRYNGTGNGWDFLKSITYGDDGNIYATGESYSSGADLDFIVSSLTISGDTNWIYRYNGPGNSYDYAFSLVYGTDGNIYTTGASSDDFMVISLDPDVGIEERNNKATRPSNKTTIISGPLQLPKDRKCKVFDIAGRMVMPDQLKPGVYFIQIDNKIVQKVVKVR